MHLPEEAAACTLPSSRSVSPTKLKSLVDKTTTMQGIGQIVADAAEAAAADSRAGSPEKRVRELTSGEHVTEEMQLEGPGFLGISLTPAYGDEAMEQGWDLGC